MRLEGEKEKKTDKKNSRCQSEELARLPETEEGSSGLKKSEKKVQFREKSHHFLPQKGG